MVRVHGDAVPARGVTGGYWGSESGISSRNVEWEGAFYRGYMNNDPPPELSDSAAVKAIAAFQKEGLEALKAQLEAGN